MKSLLVMVLGKRGTRAFGFDARGATAIHYALIAAMIAFAIVAGLSALGGPINNLYLAVAGAVGAFPGAR